MDHKPPRGDEPSGKLITFPDGRPIDTKELNIPAVVAAVNSIPTVEIIDPSDITMEVQEREQYVKRQEMVQAIDRKASTSELIDLALKEIIEESAHIKFDRRKAAKEGKNTANFSAIRIGTLRSMAEVLLKRKEASLSEKLDLKSPRFQKILKSWMEFVYKSMQKVGIGDEEIDLVFNQMKADLIEWEKSIVELD